jgi:Ca2+-binding RTX toxin-like protein
MLILFISLVTAVTVQAEEVSDEEALYLYYFETDDVLLREGESQQYRFATLPDEDVTLVAYGLDALVLPQLTLYDAAGELVTTGISAENQGYVQTIRFSSDELELFSFEVTALSADENGGLVRVMLFEGEAIGGDLTYIDTVNPLLPGRAFMVSGSDKEHLSGNLGLQTRVQVLPVERFRERPEVFASRGSEAELPPLDDRFDPGESDEWWNEGEESVFFFTVSPIPEQLTDVTREIEYETYNLLTFFYFDYFFIIGEGSDPVFFQGSQPCSEFSLDTRAECLAESDTFGREVGEALPGETSAGDDGVVEINIDTVAPTRDNIQFCQVVFIDIPPFVIVTGLDITATTAGEVVDGSYCNDTLRGTPGITGTEGNDLFGYYGDDVLLGSGANDTLVGGFGDDSLAGGAGQDQFFGEDGNDYLTGNIGDATDNIVGGTGNDIVNYSANYDADAGTFTENGTPGTTGITVLLPEETGVLSTTGPANTAGQPDNINGVEGVIGTSGDDTLTGSSLNNLIMGSLGDDVIDGGAGDDYLYGLSTTAGISFDGDATAEITETAGNDSNDNDDISGGAGNDVIYGNGGDDTLDGGADNDQIYGGADDDDITGGTGDDRLDGEAGNDELLGGTGNDIIITGEGNDIAEGGTGDDVIYVTGSGVEELQGDAGADLITIMLGASLGAGSTIDLAVNDDNSVDTLSVMGPAPGTGTSDLILGNQDVLNYASFSGSINANLDTAIVSGTLTLDVTWADTTNTACATTGLIAACDAYYDNTPAIPAVTFISGGFDDVITGSMWASDSIAAEDGNDTVYGSMGADTLVGGAGVDLISFLTAFDNTTVFEPTDVTNYNAAGVTIDLSTGTIAIDIGNSLLADTTTNFNQIVSGFENIQGSVYDDTLTGDAGNNIIFMTTGSDAVNGMGGVDTADFSDMTAGALINLDTVTTTDAFSSNTYVVNSVSGTISNVENVIGTNFDDTVYASAVSNTIAAGTGFDTLSYDTDSTGVVISAVACAATCGDGSVGAADGVVLGSGTDVFYSIEELESADTVVDNYSISGNFTTTYGAGELGTSNDTVDDFYISGGVGADNITFGNGTMGYFVVDSDDENTIAYSSFTAADVIFVPIVGQTFQQLIYQTLSCTVDPVTFVVTCVTVDNATDVYVTFVDPSIACTTPGGANPITGTSSADTFDTSGIPFDTLQSNCNEIIDGLGGNDTADYSNVNLLAGEFYEFTLDSTTGITSVTGGSSIGTDSLTSVETILGSSIFQDVLVITGNTGTTVNLTFNSGSSAIASGVGADLIDFSNITLAAGIDINLSSTGAQDIYGAAGNVQLTLAGSIPNVLGSQGSDGITGSAIANIIDGNEGVDVINAGAGNDTIIGTDDDDNDTYNGGADSDVVDYSAITSNIAVAIGAAANTTTATVNGGVDTLQAVETVILGSGADTVTVGTGLSGMTTLLVQGGAGTDTFDINSTTGMGNVTLDGQADSDTYLMNDEFTVNISDSGTTGIDLVHYDNIAAAQFVTSTSETGFTVDNDATAGGNGTLSGIENITSGTGNDTFTLTYDASAASVANTFNAAGGTADIADYRNTTAALTITESATDTYTVASGTGATDTLLNFESVIAGQGDDTFVTSGSPTGTTFNGLTGSDTVEYSTATALTVATTASATTNFTVTDGTSTDTLTNVEGVTTGAGNDIFNINLDQLDADSASAVTFTFNPLGGTNTFNFTATTTATSPINIIINAVTGSITNFNFTNVTGTGGVDIDLSDTSTQTVFTNFTVTLNGVEEASVTGTTSADNITGNNFVNTLTGGAGDDVIVGLGGDDTIDGGTGADTIDGGAGNDTLDGGTNNDTVAGGDGDDTIDGGTGNDTLSGGLGNDTVTGGDGNDTVVGGEYVDCAVVDPCTAGADGTDQLTGDAGDDTLVGGNYLDCSAGAEPATAGSDGADTIYGGNGTTTGDTIHGDNFLDTCTGTAGTGGDDTLYGGNNNADGTVEGNETIGADTINGGDGDDTLYGGNNNTGLGTANSGTTSGADTINGQAGNDTIYGGNNNTNVGGNGSGTDANGDVLSGGEGNDTIHGGNNNTGLTGGGTAGNDGTDTINDNTNTVSDTDTVYGDNNGAGTGGNDTINVDDGDAGVDTGNADSTTSAAGTGGGDTVNQDAADTVQNP